MEVLGHSEMSVRMNTCTHVLAQLREDAADAVDEVLGIWIVRVGSSIGSS